jgi:hypothetical protein
MKLNEVSSDRIDELKAAAALATAKRAGTVATQGAKVARDVIAKGAKVAGQVASAATKKAAPVVGNVAKKAGAVAAKAGKAVGKEVGAAYKGAKEIGKSGVEVAKAAGTLAKDVNAPGAVSNQDKMKAAQQLQKAGMGAKLAGGKNAQKFTRGVQDLQGGKAIRADLAQELKPHITNLQNILSNPALRVKWLQLVKQANQSVGK